MTVCGNSERLVGVELGGQCAGEYAHDEVLVDHEQGQRTASDIVSAVEALVGRVVGVEPLLEPIHEVTGGEAQQDLASRRGDARIASETTPTPLLQEVFPDRAHGSSVPRGPVGWKAWLIRSVRAIRTGTPRVLVGRLATVSSGHQICARRCASGCRSKSS